MDNATQTQARESLEKAKASIEERRQRLAKHVQHREEAIPQDFSEQAVVMENDETMVALDAELAAQEDDIARAFERLDAGTYGVCTQCGEAVEPDRLEALPATATCRQCAD